MKTRKKIQWGSISLLLLFIGSMNFHHIMFNPVDLQALNTNKTEKISVGNAMSSDYTPDFTGNGEECNITLQQSLIESSPIIISNSSDPLNNTFYEPCPTVEDFPSSSTFMSIEDIYAPNKTIILEEGSPDDYSDELGTLAYFTSFSTRSSCFLVNASFEFSIGSTPIVSIYLYNSSWNSVYSRNEPNVNSGMLLNSGTPTATGWYEFDLLDTFLNNSETQNNTWFLCPYREPGVGFARWRYKYTGTDNSMAYSFDGTLSHLSLYFLCTVGVAPFIPNQYKELELETSNAQTIYTDEYAFSFKVKGPCILDNFSLCFTEMWATSDDAEISIDVFDAIYNSSLDAIVPNHQIQRIFMDFIIPDASEEKWFNFTNINMNLDPTDTENNTFFIWLTQVSSVSLSRAQFHYVNDGIDNVSTWLFGTGSTDWQLLSIDPSFKINLVPVNNLLSPDDVSLRINNSEVINQPNRYNSGYWISSTEYFSSSGLLGFTFSADWWDVSCTITSIQIVYTKTDVKANANFTIVGSGQEVLWNVTDSEGLNYLDSRINEATTINFTVPTSWDNINVFNGTINKTDVVSIRDLNNRYSEICVLNAGSGNWFLTASSANLLESIDSYIGSRPESIFNYSNIAHFNASFKETIFQDDGLVNLSIYSPALINDVLNFTIIKTTFGTGQEVSLGDWDLSDNVTQYGVFRVQVSWYNKTSVGFLEAQLTIIGESDLVLIEPPQNAIYDLDQQFNIIVYYEDVHLHRAIGSATINFNIANQGWEATTVNNGTTGYYVIPVNCSEFASSGSKHVEITATLEFYSSPTLEYLFEIIEGTTSTTTTQPDTSTSTTTTTTTTQPDTITSTVSTTTQETTSKSTTTTPETGNFPSVLVVLVAFGTLVMITRRRKKM